MNSTNTNTQPTLESPDFQNNDLQKGGFKQKQIVIIDTNILIRAPDLLRQWTPFLEFIIPDFVHQELITLAKKRNKVALTAEGMLHETDDLTASGFVSLFNTPQNVPDVSGDPRISDVDRRLISLASHFAKQGKDVTIATDDFRLAAVCRERKVKAVNSSALRQLLAGLATTPREAVPRGNTVRMYAYHRMWRSLLAGVIIIVMMLILYHFWDYISLYIPGTGTFLLYCVVGMILYIIRSTYRTGYGLAEATTGALLAYTICGLIPECVNLKLADALKLLAALYLIVRGMDNLGIGLKGTPAEPIWVEFFGKHP